MPFTRASLVEPGHGPFTSSRSNSASAAKMPNTRRSPFRRARGATWSDSMPRPRPEAVTIWTGSTASADGATWVQSCCTMYPCCAMYARSSSICSSAERCQAAISVRRSSTSSRVIIRRPVHHVVPTTVRMTAVAAIHKSVDSVGPCRALACSVYCVRHRPEPSCVERAAVGG